MNSTPPSSQGFPAAEGLGNRLLEALPAADLQRWRPHLDLVGMAAGSPLSRGTDVPTHLVFPSTASISLMHTTRDGDSLEVVAIGSEGVVGLQALLGGGPALAGAVVRVAGLGFRVSLGWMQAEFRQCAAVTDLLLRYTQSRMMQTAQAAVCNSYHSLEQRMCRCLLSTLDHGQGAPLHLTHEGLSCMLGVRREGVTGVALKLQRAGVIQYSRGRVQVIDRPSLEAGSCECYRVVKREYDWLQPRAASPDPTVTADGVYRMRSG